VSVHVRDTDHGYDALVKRVFEFERPRIEVGILEEDGAAPHGGGGDPVTIIEVAVWNEFGTENIPARSFIREWFDTHESELRVALKALMISVVRGQRTKEQILELLGQMAVGQIQERISEGIPPENAPATVARKGSSTPLVNTGVLRSSVSYRVEEG
jgi:hypothetical protein